ncbi:hypothetical protein [Polymorphobacter sp.]|uniref:hypothetical protein n=1 Tax=Polymorphobacter sp. TaxID=1909290 RepID=UPI003F6F2AA5
MSVILTTLAAAALGASAPATVSHQVPVTHGSTTATAIYEAKPQITTRNIGLSPGTRQGSRRCVWTADIIVERHLKGEEGVAMRTLAPGKTISGSRPGHCRNGTKAINDEIASRAPEIREHLMAVAERDGRELRTELETMGAPSAS